MPASPLALVGLGFVLGLRHALDVDHLAAVSAIVGRGGGLWRSSLVGALWGVGHTVALLAAAAAMIALQVRMPPAVAVVLELGVAAMLVLLGTSLLRALWRGGTVHLHVHEHAGRRHVHAHLHAAPGTTPRDGGHAAHASRAGHHATRPLLVGMLHGLAGSAGLMLVVLAAIPDTAASLAYVAAFGAGSIGGMAAMSTLIGLPLAWAAARFQRIELGLRASAAVASVAVGLWLAWEVGVAAGLLV